MYTLKNIIKAVNKANAENCKKTNSWLTQERYITSMYRTQVETHVISTERICRYKNNDDSTPHSMNHLISFLILEELNYFNNIIANIVLWISQVLAQSISHLIHYDQILPNKLLSTMVKWNTWHWDSNLHTPPLFFGE